MESSHFLAVSSPCGTLQNCFLWFLIDRLYVGLYGRYTGNVWAYSWVFGDGQFNGTMQNVVGPAQRNFGKFGLFFHKIACKSANVRDRPDMFGPTKERRPGEPIFVAMATTFALGAESYRLPACLYVCLSRQTSNRFVFVSQRNRALSGAPVNKWLSTITRERRIPLDLESVGFPYLFGTLLSPHIGSAWRARRDNNNM